jgi:hypothetical protein
MHAKAPLDVDLEDKLLYGLTPIRLAYLVVALLSAFALWSSPWAPSSVRIVFCVMVVAIGAGVAWGRWRGRPADAWLADISIFAVHTHRLKWNWHWLERLGRRRIATQPVRAPASPIAIVVAGRTPKAGASTVAVELEACLAADERWSVKTALPVHEGKPSPTYLLISVAAMDHGRVCYLDRGEGPFVAGLIPEDEAVHQAAALHQATVVAFPDAPASRAFRDLAGTIAACAS